MHRQIAGTALLASSSLFSFEHYPIEVIYYLPLPPSMTDTIQSFATEKKDVFKSDVQAREITIKGITMMIDNSLPHKRLLFL
jgi:hypothetical protein